MDQINPSPAAVDLGYRKSMEPKGSSLNVSQVPSKGFIISVLLTTGLH